MTSSVFCYSRHGFLELQSPVSSLWMYPRPPFQPQPYSFGIIVPKEILGNTDLKTAISSTVFVTLHSSTESSRKYYFVATTKRGRMEQSYKAAACLRGTFFEALRKLWNGRIQLCTRGWRSKFFSCVTAYGIFSYRGEQDYPIPSLHSSFGVEHCYKLWTRPSSNT